MYPGHFVRRDVAEEKRRQLIRQTDPGLRQLEAKLRLAYVNKERAAQLEERKLAREIGKRDKEVNGRFCYMNTECRCYMYLYRV